jgi:hypothetical protein
MTALLLALALGADGGTPPCKSGAACCKRGVEGLRELERYQGTVMLYREVVEGFERACALKHRPSCGWQRALSTQRCPPGFEPHCAALALKLDGKKPTEDELKAAKAGAAQKTPSSADWVAWVAWSRAEIATCGRKASPDAGR